MSQTIRTDRALLRANVRSRRFLLAPLTAPPAPRGQRRPALDLALVLDRSGSMHGQKIELARRAAVEAIGRLGERDRFAVVVYDDQVDVLVPARPATPAARFEAEALLAGVEPRGATDLAGGWRAGCESLVEERRDGGLARCLLLTDGLANHGVCEPEAILAQAAEMRRRGVATSTFGVGQDFDEALLGGLAEAAGGHFYFVERAQQIPAFLSAEVDEALEVTVRNLRLVVEGPAGLEVRSLNDHPVEVEDGVSRIFLGDLVSEQQIAPVLELRFPRLPEGETAAVSLRWEAAEGEIDETPSVLTWRVASHADNDTQDRDRTVDRSVATLFAARARRRAHLANRAGRGDVAAGEMRRCAARIRSYAGDDAVLAGIAAGLDREAADYGSRMDALTLKLRYSSSVASLKQRTLRGLARRASSALEPITVLPTTAALRPVAREALGALAAVEGGFDPPAGLGAKLELPTRRGPQTLSHAAETRLVDQACAAAPGLRIVLTTRRLHDNWFSHWHDAHRVAVVSLHGWSALSALSPASFVAYEIVLHGLRRHAGYDPHDLLHEETRGCLFDLCREKGAIDAKLQSVTVCPACHQALDFEGLPVDSIHALGEAIRSLARRGAAAAS